MPTRILIQLAEPASPHVPPDVQTILDAAGARDVRPSHPELPGLHIAILDDPADADAVVSQLSALPSVRYAEVERFRFT